MNYFALIDQYIKGELSSSARTAFEEQMKQDPELRREVELEQMADILIDEAVKEDIAGQIRDILSNSKPNKRSIIRKLYFAIPIAASLALLIGFFFIGTGDYNPTEFAVSQYDEYRPNFSSSRGDVFIEDIQILLDSGKGAQAEILLKASESPDPYLLGHAYFLQGKYQEALNSFEVVKEEDVVEGASFYRALTLMALGQTESGIKELNKISKQKGHTYSALSQNILEEWN